MYKVLYFSFFLLTSVNLISGFPLKLLLQDMKGIVRLIKYSKLKRIKIIHFLIGLKFNSGCINSFFLDKRPDHIRNESR